MSKAACALLIDHAMGKRSNTAANSTRMQHRGAHANPIAAHQQHRNFNGNPHSQPQPTAVQHAQLTRSAKNKKLFPQKLWDLINDHKYNFCLRWSDDGQLVYLNRDQFEDSYLKTPENQFHTQKAISFVRQMNMYGFRKVDDCYYENDNFKRNCDYLLKNMIRKHPNKAAQSQGAQQLACQRQPFNDGQSTTTSHEPSAVIMDGLVVHRQRQNEHKDLLILNQHHHQQQQQNNTQYPTDLTMTQEKRHLNNLPQQSNSETTNMNLLYSLLVSINSNLYQPLMLNQQPAPQASSDLARDADRLADLQQVYQHIFEQLLYKTSI